MVVKTSTRINITLPNSLMAELKKYVPPRKRNQFIVAIIEKELNRMRLQNALQESAGAWAEEEHPALTTVDEINAYVRQLRESSLPGSWVEATRDENG